MRRASVALLAALCIAAPADAQDTSHHHHGAAATPATGEQPADKPGDVAPPSAPSDHAADRFFDPARMARARAVMAGESRFRTFTLGIGQLEYRTGKHPDSYAWEAGAWYGGDIDRFAIASEGEGAFGKAPEKVEIRAFWRHAINPWFNLQLGARHDVRPDPERSYAMIGIDGVAPYWIEVEAQAFFSDKGDAHFRAKLGYDQRITQRLVLEPEVEIDVSLQDVPELGIGSGIESVELGARLRYEIRRELAPYIGIHWERRLGETADLVRAHGETPGALSAVVGLRAAF